MPLSYLIQIDQGIIVWILEIMDLHFPILSLALRELVKSKFQPYCQESKARRRWLHKFSQRHRPAL